MKRLLAIVLLLVVVTTVSADTFPPDKLPPGCGGGRLWEGESLPDGGTLFRWICYETEHNTPPHRNPPMPPLCPYRLWDVYTSPSDTVNEFYYCVNELEQTFLPVVVE